MWEAKGMTIFTSENLKKWFFAAISRQPDLYL